MSDEYADNHLEDDHIRPIKPTPMKSFNVKLSSIAKMAAKRLTL